MNQICVEPVLPFKAPTHIALIGNSVPRRCGIATFTSDCRAALATAYPDLVIDHYAMDTGMDDIAYPPGVRSIRQDDPIAYAVAAQAIAQSGAQAIWLQHEYGIFGGPAGAHILELLDRTSLPLVTTLHTVLENPTAEERQVMKRLLARSAQVMVMATRAAEILRAVYSAADLPISVIPHGVPDRPYAVPDMVKPRFGWSGKVILTFGLLAPDKGIDRMIRAMPGIVARHPDARYIVLGATHPNLVREEGEALRDRLRDLAEEMGVGAHVEFIDGFVEQEQLLDYLQAADIYVTPYVNPAQVTSGTLSYAVGLGKPVVATPYVHAMEILADDCGILVPFGDSEAMAEAVCRLLGDDMLRAGYAARAYRRGRDMLWSELARRVCRLIGRAREGQPVRLSPRREYGVLTPDLSAVLRMSDATGLLQHGILSVPDRNHGYCLDDNARALMLMTQLPATDDPEELALRDRWTTTYAAFVQHAWDRGARCFRNFMGYDRRWLEREGSEDSCGRAFWALGVVSRDAPQPKHRAWAAALFDEALVTAEALASPRAQAFAMLGAAAVVDWQPDHPRARPLMERFGRGLLALLEESRRPDWSWFEIVLAYDNARLPEALLRAGLALGDAAMVETGLSTLGWIVTRQTTQAGDFRAVGTQSFGRPYADPLPFDQQPLEAQATIDAALAALEATGNPAWIDVAEAAYQWFLGRNDLHLPLATREDGGCYDGLTPTGVNRNQGAESLLALQLATCSMKHLCQTHQIVAPSPAPETELASA